MGQPLQGVDIPVAIAWATTVLGRQGVCDALSVDETTLAGLSEGALEADGALRTHFADLLDSVESVGLGRPPATQAEQQVSDGSMPRAAPAPGVVHKGIAEPRPTSTQRSPVPASYEEAHKQRSFLYKLVLIRQQLRRDRDTFPLTVWQDVSVELAIIRVELALIDLFGGLIPVEESPSRGLEDEKEWRIRRIREIEFLKPSRMARICHRWWGGGLIDTKKLIHHVLSDRGIPPDVHDLSLYASIIRNWR